VSARSLLARATERLAEAGVASPRADAELLLCHVTGVPRALLTVTARVDEAQRRSYLDLIEARARRVPLQHLTGTASFRHVDLEVGPGVFVPRPETELLAGWAIEEADRRDAAVVVDLGAGSGAIALSVVSEAPTARVYAVELDERAYDWAWRNLDGSGVVLRRGDMAEAFPELNGAVDVVVANPPYIPLTAWQGVATEARDHDPQLALWSGPDGLDAMRVVEQVAWRLLAPGGVVGVEHAEAQEQSVRRLFAGRWSEVRDHRDLADRPRYLTARRPPTHRVSS